MRKLLATIIVLLIMALAVAPLVGAYLYHSSVESKIAETRFWLRTNGLTQIQVDLKKVNWGWLSSDYEVHVFWRGKRDKVKINNVVHHGPFPLNSAKQLDSSPWRPRLAYVNSVVDFSQMGLPFLMPSLSVDQDIDFVGNVDAHWRFLAFLNKSSDSKLDAASSSGNLHYFAAENRVAGTGTVPDMRLKHKSTKLQISDLNLDFEFTKIQEAVVPVGEIAGTIELGRWQNENSDYRIKHASVAFGITDFEQENNFQLKLGSDAVQINEVQLLDNDWDAILRGIGASGIDVVIPKGKVSSFSEYTEQVTSRIDQYLPQVLSGTELEVLHVESTHETGVIRGFLRTNVPPLENVESMSTEQLVGQMKMLSEISVPKPLVHAALGNELGVQKFKLSEKYQFLKKRTRKSVLDELAGQAVDQQIQVIVASGLVTETQGNYFSNIELNEGNISFNGHIVHGF